MVFWGGLWRIFVLIRNFFFFFFCGGLVGASGVVAASQPLVPEGIFGVVGVEVLVRGWVWRKWNLIFLSGAEGDPFSRRLQRLKRRGSEW